MRGALSSIAARRSIVAAARELQARGVVTGTTGNVSVRTARGFLITPSRRRYTRMRSAQIISVSESGAHRGRVRPSRETKLHTAVYRERPDVGAIVHHHGPYVTAWSFLGGQLQPRLTEDGYLGIGPVSTTPFAPAGSMELAERCAATLLESNATLLAGHGLVAVGATIATALDVSLAVEHEARVALLLRAGQIDPTAAPLPSETPPPKFSASRPVSAGAGLLPYPAGRKRLHRDFVASPNEVRGS